MHYKPKIAIVGLGRWGQNLKREFEKISEVTLVPHRGKPSYQQVLATPEITAVVIATPIATHYELAKQALEAGKHVFVEKPLAEAVAQASELVKLAEAGKLILAVGHIFLYHPVVDKIKEVLGDEEINYFETAWYKYGTFEESLSSNLLCHDLALMLYLMGQPKYLRTVRSKPNIFAGLAEFTGDKKAHFYLNRLAPFKNKSVLVKTQTQTLWWLDDQLFQLTATGYQSVFKADTTPLELECAAFITAVTNPNKPSGSIIRADGQLGLEVVKLLEAATWAK